MSADQGNVGGQHKYEICLECSRGAAQDVTEAAKY
jgi:hypothetical protein